MHNGKKAISIILIVSFLLSPTVVIAQQAATSDPCTGMTGASLAQCRNVQSTSANAAASAQVRARFNPSGTVETSNGGRTFSGLSFSGVGGAVAGCTNLGTSISGGINSITNIFANKRPTVANTPTPSSGVLNNSTNISNSPSVQQSITQSGRDLSKPSMGVSNTSNAMSKTSSIAISDKVPIVATKTDEELKTANKREACLNGVAYAVAKGLLRQVTDKTLNWVNTGFSGNPLYVRDIDSFMQSISDERISQFLDQIPNRDPIFGNAIRSIATEQLSGIQDGLIGTVMDTPEARNYEAFQDNFADGGWKRFLDPDYNAVGVIFETADELATDVDQQQENAKIRLENGNGFLDLQRCVEYADENKPTYPFTYKGFACSRNIQAEANTFYNTCVTTNGSNSEASCRLQTDQTFTADVLTSTCIPAATAQAQKNDPRQCLRYETVTPGSIIQAQVAEVTTSPVRQLEQADQINEVLGAFFDQLLNKLLTDGLSSLRGRSSTSFSFGGVGTNVVLGTNGSILSSAQAGASALGYQQAGSGYRDEFDISRPQHLRAVLQTQYNYFNRMLDARAALNRIVPTLGALDYCIPGPNPTWQKGLQENVDVYFGGLHEYTKEMTGLQSFALQRLQQLPIFGSLFTGNKPHGVMSTGIGLFDKVTQTTLPIRDTIYFERNRSPGAVFNNITLRWSELMATYQSTFTPTAITNAFISVNPSNAAYATGFVATAFEETAQLPEYSAASFEIDAYYNTAEGETRAAINRLEAIRRETNTIVATAKARHIAEQAAAGTPVNRACIDDAYVVDTSPIVPVTRQESSDPSPMFNRFIEANNYFYTTL